MASKKAPDDPHTILDPNFIPPPVEVLAQNPDMMPRVPEAQIEFPEPDVVISRYRTEKLHLLTAERARRKIEALSLFDPLPDQQTAIDSTAMERIIRGSNRSGKTLTAAVIVANAVTGRSLVFPKTNGRMICVAKDGKHVGDVMWRKLSRAGAFKIIRDERTKKWRSFKPWDKRDQAREHEAKPAPPLIPPRLIKEIAWENKKESCPSKVVLHTGWELLFYSSNATPPTGLDVDGAWFDEEIVNQSWYAEIAARLLDRHGRFLWSATPQAGTEQLYILHEQAEDLKGTVKPRIEEIILLLENNPHISDEDKKLFSEKMTEEERAVRIGGEFALLTSKVFPTYTPFYYDVDPFQIPQTWTRYLAIDPGFQVCAVLFLAVPPPDFGDFNYIYDELYIKNCDAIQFGQKMAAKCQGQTFKAFVIDHHGGAHSEAGSGRTIEDQYAEQLRVHRLKSEDTGAGFMWGNDNPKAGVEACKALLRIREDGTSKIRTFRGMLPNFNTEMKRYRYKRVQGVLTDDPEARGAVHACACFRYLAMLRPKYSAPKRGKHVQGAILAFRAKEDRRKKKEGGSFVNLGPRERK